MNDIKIKKNMPRELAWISAMFINSFAISLLVKSSFGISTLSSLPLVLSDVIKTLSFGTTTTIVQCLLLLIVMLITRQPKMSYLFSFVIAFAFGLLVDLFDCIASGLPDLFWCRMIYFISGWLLISFGGALFICSQLPLMPNDCAVRDISDYSGITVKKIKTLFDAIFVSLALIISWIGLHSVEGVGVGTIIMMLFTGTITQFFLNYLQNQYLFVSRFSFSDKLVSFASIKKRTIKAKCW